MNARRRPQGEAEEQADDDRGRARVRPGTGNACHRDAEQHDPPDRRSHLVAWDRVIAAVFEAEIDDEKGGEEPCRGPAPVGTSGGQAVALGRDALRVVLMYSSRGAGEPSPIGFPACLCDRWRCGKSRHRPAAGAGVARRAAARRGPRPGDRAARQLRGRPVLRDRAEPDRAARAGHDED